MTSTNGPIAESDDPAPRPVRRRFPAEYKLRIVAEYDAAPTGEKGAILRRERLYHSHIICDHTSHSGIIAAHGPATSPKPPPPNCPSRT